MKTRFILDRTSELDFEVLAINSHTKAYKLCWVINKHLQLNFEKKNDYNISEGLWFSKYTSVCADDVEYTLLGNQSKEGYLIPDQKSVNFFLIIKNYYWQQEKVEFISKLREIKDVLFVFELDINLTKHIDRFIFNDKKD